MENNLALILCGWFLLSLIAALVLGPVLRRGNARRVDFTNRRRAPDQLMQNESYDDEVISSEATPPHPHRRIEAPRRDFKQTDDPLISD